MRRFVTPAVALLCLLVASLAALAGTTGAVVGTLTDAATGRPIAGARVSVASPSQTAVTETDARGSYRFISLAPDSYVLTVQAPGYDGASVSGVLVLADQSITVNQRASRTLQTIGSVRARSSSDLIKPGTTSDVYSVNAAGAEAAQALGGPGGLNSAYSAIASVPGVNVQQGQQGWFQSVSIRGGDIDQVGYELDGIPVNRVYDNAPQTMLSNLGQQELQIYTGGTPATADASGIAGYVNQVVRTGTYPGFASANFGLGGPSFYHKASFEAGGANANRTFSYYVGFAGVNQDYRYVDQFNGVSDPRLFYPVAVPGRFNIWDGTPGTLSFAPGATYSIANTSDRENVVNLHLGLPHHHATLKDDVQLLYVTSEQLENYFSSINDQGGPANVASVVGNNGNGFQHDGYGYTGPLFAPVQQGKIVPYAFPNAPGHGLGAPVSNDARDYSDNGVSLTKLQYQRNFDQRSYLRLYGYTEYSNWYIGGPSNEQFTNGYGAELNDYELPSHTFGLNANYSNQLSDKHLLAVTGSYTGAQVSRRFGYSFPGNTVGGAFSNLVGPGNLCYGSSMTAATGYAQTSCFGGARGTFPATPPNSPLSNLATYQTNTGTFAVTTPAGGTANATWLATENGSFNNRLNTVSPAFTAGAITDQWRPNDRTTVTLGARLENYDNRLANTTGTAARQFWFDAYDNEYCYKPGAAAPRQVTIGGAAPDGTTIAGASPALCNALYGAGWTQANLVNAQAKNVTATIFEPRLGATYELNSNSVLRGSFGVYARPVNTSWLQYNEVDQNLASFIGGFFLPFGYNTPVHDLRPDTSYNADFSLEQRVPHSDVSFKLTPFYRATKNQLQPIPIGVGGVVSGFNVGRQTSSGIEFALKKGDFGRDGFALQLAYTYTHSRIRYSDFPNGTNVIDNLNAYVSEYNSYTSACAVVTKTNAALCGLPAGTANPNAAATFASGGTGASVPIANPYYGAAAQPLFDRSGSYTTYDEIPLPFTGANGYETPHVASLIASYKHGRATLTPSLTYSSGAKYGSPLVYPGYIPSGGCAATGSATGAGAFAALPSSCGGSSNVSGLPFLMIPDAFTGRFDPIGAFDQPQRLTLNFSGSYEAARNVKLNFAVTGLVDTCFQRGYAWDDAHICVYSQLPSGSAGFGPSGNFVPVAKSPPQTRFPYGVFNNNLNTGFVGTTIPVQATMNLQVRL